VESEKNDADNESKVDSKSEAVKMKNMQKRMTAVEGALAYLLGDSPSKVLSGAKRESMIQKAKEFRALVKELERGSD
jgi:hypothetical protein